MTPEEIEKLADEYVRTNPFVHPYNSIATRESFKDGIVYALSHQWIPVEERLPEEDKRVLVRVLASEFHYEYYAVAYWDNEDCYTQDGELIRPDFWLPIPPFNPEK